MGIKRNEVAEPQWNFLDYAVRSKANLFSAERWGETADWYIILNQVEKARKASQMIDINIYPSSLFLTAIDLLEANLLMVDDLFYYITGVRIPWSRKEWEEARKRLVFWNMDCYEVLKKIRKGLLQIKENLNHCLKQEPIWDISLKVGKIRELTALTLGPSPVIPPLDYERYAYEYAHKYYEVTEIDQEALAAQIKRILDILQEYAVIFLYIYNEFPDFSHLLALFCQSEKARTEYIDPWRHDFDGTRDSLIAKMEKDPRLGPWVNRFVHLPKVEKIHYQLFFSDKNHYMPTDEEECYNTNNWISILTIAAVLQEYDKYQAAPDEASDKDKALLLRLSLFFKDENAASRFWESAKAMKTNDEVIELVKKNIDYSIYYGKSKKLWSLLYDEKIYTKKYSNWCEQLKKK